MKNIFKLALLFIPFISTGQTPVTITLQPGPNDGKDAEVFSCKPCGYTVRNFGKIGDLNAVAWTNNGNSSNIRSYIQFDLSAIPPGSNINDARLSLYYTPHSDEGKHFKHFGDNKGIIKRVTSAWNELTITWDNQPTNTSLNQTVMASTTSSTQNYPDINVTALVQDMIDNPATSFGFMFRLKTEKPYRKLVFASSDYANASKRPKLVITYTPPTPPATISTDQIARFSSVVQSSSLPTFNVFPDPAQSAATIRYFAESADEVVITSRDISGSEIFRKNAVVQSGQNEFIVPVAHWKKGIYFLSIVSGSAVVSKKLVVQ